MDLGALKVRAASFPFMSCLNVSPLKSEVLIARPMEPGIQYRPNNNGVHSGREHINHSRPELFRWLRSACINFIAAHKDSERLDILSALAHVLEFDDHAMSLES
jgi:hypothetical protein